MYVLLFTVAGHNSNPLFFFGKVFSIVPIEACVSIQPKASNIYVSFILLVGYDAGEFPCLRFRIKTKDLCGFSYVGYDGLSNISRMLGFAPSP